MRNFILLSFIFVVLQSCSLEPKIIITRDSITNSYWNNNYNNAIHVEKLKQKKSLGEQDYEFNPEQIDIWAIADKFEPDSTFYFGYSGLNIKKEKKKLKGKISFIEDNGFSWYTNDGEKKIIGELENNTWYKFSKLQSRAFYVFIYIDNDGKVYSFNQDLSNF